MSTVGTGTGTPKADGDYGQGSISLGEIAAYILVFIIGVLIILIFFSRKVISLIGGKSFLILIGVSAILNLISSYITSCFGQGGKKENFNPMVAGAFITIFIILALILTFYSYLIKYLGLKNYLIVICVISLISSLYGWSQNCN